ncbi:MAG: hypothetical protein WC532_00035 [Candidatus Omnitrophota bacterium]
MNTSIFIARIFGLFYLIVGIGFLLNRKAFQDVIDDFCKSAALLFYGGSSALIIGIVIILTHNLWVADWAVIITVIGWLALAKGIWIIVFPGAALKFMQAYRKNKNISMFHPFAALILGAVLIFFGFFAGSFPKCGM